MGLKVLAICNHQEQYQKMFAELPTDMEVITATTLLESMEALNFHNPNIIVIALTAGCEDLNILPMLPQKDDADYTPFILIGSAEVMDTAEELCHPKASLIPPFSVHSLASKIYLHQKRRVSASIGNEASHYQD